MKPLSRPTTSIMFTVLVLATFLAAPAATQIKLLNEFMQCLEGESVADRTPCNWFVGKAVEKLWGIKDFCSPTTPGTYLLANQIADKAASSVCWKHLGTADTDEGLEEAARLANESQPVIATYRDDPHGHVALVIQGPMIHSNSWGTNVPRAASFALGSAARSFVDGPLSRAFGAGKRPRVNLYARLGVDPECLGD